MRLWFGVLVCSLMSFGPAAADDAGPKPLKPKAAADLVAAAVEAGDDAALAKLASSDRPDPWRVADELCHAGKHDAAMAFARAAPRPALAALPAYIDSLRGAESDAALRKQLEELRVTFAAGDHTRTLELLGPAPESLPQNMGPIRLACTRARALFFLNRHAQASAAFARAAQTAERMGWLTKAADVYTFAALADRRGAAYKESLAHLAHSSRLWQRVGDERNLAVTASYRGSLLYSLGDYAAALDAYEFALEVQVRLGDGRGAAATRSFMGNSYKALGRYDEALAVFSAALKAHEAVGNHGEVASTRNNLATVYLARGQPHKALVLLKEARSVQQGLGDQRMLARTDTNIANTLHSLGRFEEALATNQRVLAIQLEVDDRHGVARTQGNLSATYLSLGDYSNAQSCIESALATNRAIGNREGIADNLTNLAIIRYRSGDFTRALSTFERARDSHEADGRRAKAALLMNNIGATQSVLGDIAAAIATHEAALKIRQELGDKPGEASSLFNLGTVYDSIGLHDRGLSMLEAAFALYESISDEQGAAQTLRHLGGVHHKLGDLSKALDLYERALKRQLALGDKRGIAATQNSIGSVLARQGDSAKSLELRESALKIYESVGDKAAAASVLRAIGELQLTLGRTEAARESLERSIRTARYMRAVPILVRGLAALAYLHVQSGDPALGLGRAREALREVEGMLGALGEEEGATARGQQLRLFAVGALAAMRTGDAAEALTFLDSGRAGALLDALGRREVLRWKAETLSQELRDADREATTGLNLARHRYERARNDGNRSQTRTARKALAVAEADLRAVTSRIQREVKREAGLYYPRSEPIEDVRAALAPDQALVVYGLCLGEAMALVLRPDSERLVALGKATDVLEVCHSLDASDKSADPTVDLARVRRALVDPLKLSADVREVIVSPAELLSYVPYGAVFDRPVAMTPSATTHVLLRDDRRPAGTKVLALGDPDYGTAPDPGALEVYRGGGRLTPLPATRAEAMTVGDVVLLGKKANEQALEETLPLESHWRAIHFACHGLVRPDSPRSSSLALTRTAERDGFLTCSEVLRMDIGADLVVLSACDTARGQIQGGEGIVGLTRTFMYAGSPRVLCSLWKVDDEATQALMIKFYELWNPKEGKGIGAAAALKKAQAHIRAQEKWKHPYYWAAWVLWGLPR